jgi:CheY-like chemotaxis protein
MAASDGCVLVVDDEALIALFLSDTLEELGYRVCGTAATADRAVELAKAYQPRLVLMDVRLKGQGDGVDAALRIHQARPVPVIFITGSREQATLDRIALDHPAAILFKPILPQHLRDALARILD